MIPVKTWTNGTPENNYQDGTQLDAADFESWNRELVAVIQAAGVPPDNTKFDQLSAAILALIALNAAAPGHTHSSSPGSFSAGGALLASGALSTTNKSGIGIGLTNLAGQMQLVQHTHVLGTLNKAYETALRWYAGNGYGSVFKEGMRYSLRAWDNYDGGQETGDLFSIDGYGNVVFKGTATAAGKLLGALPAGIPLDWIGLTPPSWAVVRDGSALSRSTYATLFATICPTRSGTLTSGQNTVTGLSTTLDIFVGMPIEGAGVPAGTTVASITSTSTITLSANTTVSGVQSLRLFPFGYGSAGGSTTFGIPDDRGLHVRAYDSGRGYEQSTLTADTTNASNVLTGINSTRGLYVGMPVSGAGVPTNTTIASITSATTATMSASATTTTTSVALTVTGRQVGAEGADAIQNITGQFSMPPALSSTPSGAFAWGAGSSKGDVAQQSTNGKWMLFDASLVARTGAETQVKRRTYLPIITIGT